MGTHDDEVDRWAADYAERVLQPEQISALAAQLNEAIIAAVPELAADEELRSRMRSSTVAHLRGFMGAIGQETYEINPPANVLAWPRTPARRGLELRVLPDSYLAGQRFVHRYSTSVAEARIADPELRAAVLVRMWSQTTEWVQATLHAGVLAYTEEREQWPQGAAARRADTVHALLRGDGADVDRAATALGHALRQHQTAFALWTEDALGERGSASLLESAARELAGTLGGPSPLMIPSAGHGLWVWVATPHRPDLALLAAAPSNPAARVAVGDTAPGVAGFRRSHREAVAAQRVAIAAPVAGPLIRYADVDLVCLTTGDGSVDAMRALVDRELGSLGGPGGTAKRLRDTARLYLAAGGDVAAVAETLRVHQNTVRYRIQQAERPLGYPIDRRRSHVELAPRFLDVYGMEPCGPRRSRPQCETGRAAETACGVTIDLGIGERRLWGPRMTNPHTRAADLDRSATCATLDEAYADGQLDAAEHEERLSRALAAKTLGDLGTLTADLQPVRDEPPAPEQPTSKLPGGRAIWVAGAAGLAAGIIATALVIQVSRPAPDHPGIQFSIDGQIPVGAKPIVVSVPQLQTVDGLNALIAATRTTFGNTVITRMTVFSDYAEVVRPISASPTGALHYLFRGGYQIPAPAVRAAGAPDADLAKLDVAKIIGLIAGASQTLRVPNPTVLYFEVDGTNDGTVTIHANNGFAQSGSLIAGFDGTVRQVDPFTS